MRPLEITWKTSVKSIGVEHVDFSINPQIINLIRKKSFIKFCDSSYLDHLCIYNLIPNLAVKFKVPLVVWGEDPYFEYGGSKKDSSKRTQNLEIVKNYHLENNYHRLKRIKKMANTALGKNKTNLLDVGSGTGIFQ